MAGDNSTILHLAITKFTSNKYYQIIFNNNYTSNSVIQFMKTLATLYYRIKIFVFKFKMETIKNTSNSLLPNTIILMLMLNDFINQVNINFFHTLVICNSFFNYKIITFMNSLIIKIDLFLSRIIFFSIKKIF